MRKLVVNEFSTLDGIVQAPGGEKEDTDGGFEHGGWHLQYMNDDTAQEWVLQSIVNAGGFVLGRRTWEIFAGYWPTASAEEQVIAEPLNTLPKYVASRTLSEPLGWENSHLLSGDVPEAVAGLKSDDGEDLQVIGSPAFAQTLIEHDLVDEYRLMIDPVVMGSGKRLFRENAGFRPLRLVDGIVTSTGSILATYEVAQRRAR
jgi:dihydrofolate reductase